jgi:type IV pilus assembly protein PilP
MKRKSNISIFLFFILLAGVALPDPAHCRAGFRARSLTPAPSRPAIAPPAKVSPASPSPSPAGKAAAISIPAAIVGAKIASSSSPAGSQGLQATATAPQSPGQAPPPLDFSYDPKGKPDPFKPFVDTELALKKQREAAELLKARKAQQVQARRLPLSPLRRHGIEQLKLIGIAGNERRRTAMIQDPAGKFYPVSKGTLIGLNGAKVTEIRENKIILEERQEVRSGKSKEKRTTVRLREMKLHREGGEGKP